jgi:hypothetical protein
MLAAVLPGIVFRLLLVIAGFVVFFAFLGVART